MSLAQLESDFSFLDDWEDRYKYVIDLGRSLSVFDDSLRIDSNKVRGCASQVWLISRVKRSSCGDAVLHFSGDSDAHIVRGLIAILFLIFDGRSAQDILSTDTGEIFKRLGLHDAITPQRSNGLASMVHRIMSDARDALCDSE